MKKQRYKRYRYGVYPGETDAKRLVRYLLYSRCATLEDAIGRIGGLSVVLSGPGACEIGCLRHVLKRSPSTVFFVDKDQSGLAVAKHRWPNVRTYHGDIIRLLPQLHDVGFIHLDFMGMLNDEVAKIISLAAQSLKPRGILAYTFLRGREDDRLPYWRDLETRVAALLQEHPKLAATVRSNESARTLAYFLAVSELMGGDAELISYIRYRSHLTPMGCMVFQKMPKSMQNAAWRAQLEDERYFQVLSKSEGEALFQDIALESQILRGERLTKEVFNLAA